VDVRLTPLALLSALKSHFDSGVRAERGENDFERWGELFSPHLSRIPSPPPAQFDGIPRPGSRRGRGEGKGSNGILRMMGRVG
jgi:hypothetical protein